MSERVAVQPASRRTRRAGDRARLLQRVSQAFADGEVIHWSDAEALAGSDRERALTRELRLLATIATPLPVTGSMASPYRWRHPATLERLLAAIAIGHVVLALVAGLASTPGIHAGRLLVLLATAAAATALAVHGATVRARLLSHVLWLAGALAARPLLDTAATLPLTGWLSPLWHALHVEAFLPVALWRVAREYPLIVRFTRFDRLSRGVLVASLLWSLLLALASAVSALATPASWTMAEAWLLPWRRQDAGGPFWHVLVVWAGLLAVTVFVRARQADPVEARRARVWLATTLAGVLPSIALLPARGRWPTLDASASGGIDGVGIVAAVMAAWSIAVPVLLQDARPCAPHLTGACVRRRFGTVLTCAAAFLPWPAVIRIVGASDQPLSVIVTEGGIQACIGAAIVAAVGAWCCRRGERSGRAAGTGVEGETSLAVLASALHRARTPVEVAALLGGHLRTVLGVTRTALYVPGARGWEPLDGSWPTLPFDSAIAAVLAVPGDGLVPVGREAALRRLLPAADVEWLETWGAELCVPLAAIDGPPRAALVIGGPPGGRRLGRAALAMVTSAAATGAMALERCARAVSTIETGDQELAYECAACGRVDRQPGACACGAPRQLAALPACLHGKFALERRLGRGGMGVVYLALDQHLERRVALKTLPQLGPAAVTALRAEARAMAALTHPSMAVLYGLETWRDTPVLVVEYFGGGTLATRLAQGPIAPRDAVRLGIGLAETLVDLHRRGWLHRDIKPSNLAFGRDGQLTLLDFGLTRLVARTHADGAVPLNHAELDGTPPLAGTPLYMSPEALDGADAAPSDDVWALALVVFEMVAGTLPFSDGGLDAVRRRVRRQAPPDVRAWVRSTPPSLACLLRQALHPDRTRRIGSAADLARALRAVAAQC